MRGRDLTTERTVLRVASERAILRVPAEGTVLRVAAEGTILRVAAERTALRVAADGTVLRVAAEGTVLRVAAEGPILRVAAEGPILRIATERSILRGAAEGSRAAIATPHRRSLQDEGRLSLLVQCCELRVVTLLADQLALDRSLARRRRRWATPRDPRGHSHARDEPHRPVHRHRC